MHTLVWNVVRTTDYYLSPVVLFLRRVAVLPRSAPNERDVELNQAAGTYNVADGPLHT